MHVTEVLKLNRSHSVVVILTIHEEQQKMKQGTFLGIGRLILCGEGFLRRTGHGHAERLEDGQST